MSFTYTGNHWLKSGSEFRFVGMNEYITAVKENMQRTYTIPEYVAADERELLPKVFETFKGNPWGARKTLNDSLEKLQKYYGASELVSYGSYRNLYELCLFAVNAILGEGVDPMIYTAKVVYNAAAVCYLNKVWIYISEFFFHDISSQRDIDIFCDEEIVALVGHELGHAACQHTLISMVAKPSKSINDEYSADRAGLIACTKYIMQSNPEMSVKDAANRATAYMASMLQKINVANKTLSKKDVIFNWYEYNCTAFENAQKKVERIFSVEVSKRPYNNNSTHPIDEHRIMALVFFSESEKFYRCLGFDPAKHRNLRNDDMLQNDMARLIIK